MTGYDAFFVDGESAGRHPARLRIEGDTLLILRDEGRDMTRWPLEDLRALRDLGLNDKLILRLPEGEARLVIEDAAAIGWIIGAAPGLNRAVGDRIGRRRIALWTGGAVAAMVMLLFVVIPGMANRLAPLIPAAQEEAFGAAVRDQSVRLFARGGGDEVYCTDRAGRMALDTMAGRLLGRSDVLPYPLKLSVVDSPVVNAFAVPGGHVVILRGLIEAADNPEEVAAVLAHELGHVAARDPTRLALRSAGSAGILSLMLGDVTGGALVATVAGQLIDASYARTAESDADAFAVALLHDAGVSAEALASFFDKLEAKEGEGDALSQYFASHPASADRSAAVRAADDGRAGRPVLSPSEWEALTAICGRKAPQP